MRRHPPRVWAPLALLAAPSRQPGNRQGRSRALWPLQVTRAVAAEPKAASKTGQPYDRVFNFSAGPAILPLDVLEEAQRDLINWKGSGAPGSRWGGPSERAVGGRLCRKPPPKAARAGALLHCGCAPAGACS